MIIKFLFNKNFYWTKIRDVYGVFVRNHADPITYFAYEVVYSTFVLRALSRGPSLDEI